MKLFDESYSRINDRNRQVLHAMSNFAANQDNELVLQKASALERMTRLVKTAEDFSAPIRANEPVACVAGCTYCCSLRVTITYLEGAAVAQYFVKTYGFWPAVLLLWATQQRAVEVRDWDHAQYSAKAPMCLLLRDNRCSVYPTRPTPCVGYHSVSLKTCQESFGKAEGDFMFVPELLLLPGQMLSFALLRQTGPRAPSTGELNQILSECLLDLLQKELA